MRGMGYSSDKEVVFALMSRVNFNKSIEEIHHDLGYDMGDYSFGQGDGKELRSRIITSINFLRNQFNGVFDENNNTSK